MRKTSNEGVGNLTVEVYDGNSVIKVHNALVKITGHYKPPGHFKKPVSFSANSGPLGVAKFSDIPLGMYRVEMSKEWYESSIIEKASAIIAGKDPVGHFKKPNNLLKVNMFLAPHLRFNGSKLCFIKNGSNSKCWGAVSGRENLQSAKFQNAKNKGPLPEGRWIVRQDEYQKMPNRSWIEMVLAEVGRTAWPGGESAWGKNRIWLHPIGRTKTYGRTGFSIHGGDSPGSAGCIDLTDSMPELVNMFLQYGKDMLLKVNYE
jgi:hypothetical protein